MSGTLNRMFLSFARKSKIIQVFSRLKGKARKKKVMSSSKQETKSEQIAISRRQIDEPGYSYFGAPTTQVGMGGGSPGGKKKPIGGGTGLGWT